MGDGQVNIVYVSTKMSVVRRCPLTRSVRWEVSL
jgi:hypothetical protein